MTVRRQTKARGKSERSAKSLRKKIPERGGNFNTDLKISSWCRIDLKGHIWPEMVQPPC